MSASIDMGSRSRWTKPRIARAAFLGGGGATAREIAADTFVASHAAHVQSMLRRFGIALSDAPRGNLTIEIPRKLLSRLEDEAKRRGQTPEALGGVLIRILASDPTLLANVLDDDG